MRPVRSLDPSGFAAPTAALIAVLFVAFASQRSIAVKAPASAGASPGLQAFPSPLSPYLPPDVDAVLVNRLDHMNNTRAAQRLFDIEAWRAFLALNWPALPDGRPDAARNLSRKDLTVPRVWEHWVNIKNVFRPNGADPAPWPAPFSALPAVYPTHTKAAWRYWIPQDAPENTEAFSGPLVDQSGKWVRYQVMIDYPEYRYIVANRLFNQEGQVAFSAAHRVDFPMNSGSKIGAMEIKLAWKELGPGDVKSRFFRTTAIVTDSDTGQQRKIEAGLVGMHIAMRTQSSPEWIWATFEHIDNAPSLVDSAQYPDGHPAFDNLKSHYNFFDPKLAGSVSLNHLAPKNADIVDGAPTGWSEQKTTTPVQVVRLLPGKGQDLRPEDAALRQDVQALNAQVQTLLRGQNSVFQYYELIGTQWPVHPMSPATPGGEGSAPDTYDSIVHKTPGDMIPIYLVNSTMETYFQHGVQQAGELEQDDRISATLQAGGQNISVDNGIADAKLAFGTESCVGCHYSAGIAVRFERNPDGSYVIKNNRKVPEYGIDGNFGQNGNAQFSWLLEIEAQSKPAGAQSASARKPRQLSER